MKKLFVAILASITVSAFAIDILSQVTAGKLNEKSAGVRVLSANEAAQIKGGYIVNYHTYNDDEIFAIASPVWRVELPTIHLADGSDLLLSDAFLIQNDAGLCGANSVGCHLGTRNTPIANDLSVDHFVYDYTAKYRLIDFMNIVGNNPYQYHVAYGVKRNIGYNSNGMYIYFSYSLNVFYAPNSVPTTSFRRFGNIEQFKNNSIVKELEQQYKHVFEGCLMGYGCSVR